MSILARSIHALLAMTQLILSLYQSIVLLYFAEVLYSSLETKAHANSIAKFEIYLPCAIFLTAIMIKDLPSTLLSSVMVTITLIRIWNNQISFPMAPSNKEQTRCLIESLVRAGISLIILVVSLCALMNYLRLWMIACVQSKIK